MVIQNVVYALNIIMKMTTLIKLELNCKNVIIKITKTAYRKDYKSMQLVAIYAKEPLIGTRAGRMKSIRSSNTNQNTGSQKKHQNLCEWQVIILLMISKDQSPTQHANTCIAENIFK